MEQLQINDRITCLGFPPKEQHQQQDESAEQAVAGKRIPCEFLAAKLQTEHETQDSGNHQHGAQVIDFLLMR
ncbi:hypothetical protein D3C87_2105790 [compost metagenome]